ncbi:MAG: cyclase family protein, partial [Victivallales bacterium]|nr:cyclase family protein [Victivallales bacterium]
MDSDAATPDETGRKQEVAATMTQLIDLTFRPGGDARFGFEAVRRTVALQSPGTAYTGVIYDLSMSSMTGTYLDLPGHILETDDGVDAASYPLEALYRRPAVVIHLNREDGSGAVTAAELQAACPQPIRPGQALIINALGARPCHAIAERSVYLDRSAVAWIIASGIKLLVADVYESRQLDGVFLALFRAGIAVVCI